MTGFDGIGGLGLPRPPLVGEGQAPGDEIVAGGRERGFAQRLVEVMGDLDRLDDESTRQAEALARGEPVQLHDLMIASGKSELALDIVLEVRNKLIEAWEKLQRSVM